MKSCIKAVYLISDVLCQGPFQGFLPATRGCLVDSDQLIVLFQVDDGLVIIFDKIVIDAFIYVGEIDFVVLSQWSDGFFGFVLADTSAFHTTPLSKKVLGR